LSHGWRDKNRSGNGFNTTRQRYRPRVDQFGGSAGPAKPTEETCTSDAVEEGIEIEVANSLHKVAS
jgi:hypothetical protein